MNQRIVITGGTSGLGLETARALMHAGADVVIVGRNASRGEQAQRDLTASSPQPGPSSGSVGRSSVPTGSATFEQADITDPHEVRRLARRLLTGPAVDVLINNAGGTFRAPTFTLEREGTLAVNHLGGAALTELMLPSLAKARGRVLVTTSNVHRQRFAVPTGPAIVSVENYRAMVAYGQAKLANLAWALDLAQRQVGQGVTVNAFDPGQMRTDLTTAMTSDFAPQPMRAFWPLFRASLRVSPPAETPARTYAELAVSDTWSAVTGAYVTRKGKRGRVAKAATDERTVDWATAAVARFLD
jgi:NAD(P)-dependent dehydrogenase (short-subunit alcohol dehydrogenase family)